MAPEGTVWSSAKLPLRASQCRWGLKTTGLKMKKKQKKKLSVWSEKEVSLPDFGNPLLISASGLAARA